VFQDDVGKPVREFQTILAFTAARDDESDGDGKLAAGTVKRANHLCLAYRRQHIRTQLFTGHTLFLPSNTMPS